MRGAGVRMAVPGASIAMFEPRGPLTCTGVHAQGRRTVRSSLGARAERLLEELVNMSTLLAVEAPAGAGAGAGGGRGGGIGKQAPVQEGQSGATTEKLVNESIEVGRLRQALEEEQQKGLEYKHVAREQLQSLRQQHARQVDDLEEAHAAELNAV